MTPQTWNAYNRFGDLLRSFGSRELAEDWRETRAVLGLEITIRRVVVQQRAA